MNNQKHNTPILADSDQIWQDLIGEAQEALAAAPTGSAWRSDLPTFPGGLRTSATSAPGQLRRLRRNLGMGLAGAALLLALSDGAVGAPANVITVDGTVCTLANAITAANTDTATGGCAAGSGADILNITNDIDLTSALPEISTEMTFEGEGHTIQRTGGGDFRVLKVTETGNLTLNEATISGGMAAGAFPSDAGGAIYNKGTVMVSNSTLSGNSAPSMGGGIRNIGMLTVHNSAISENSAYLGGGIFSEGMLMVQNSTISNNTGGYESGGIFNDGTLTIQNSTISGNSGRVDSGGIACRGTTMILNSTISDNSTDTYGGGIWNSGTLTVNMHAW